MQLPPPQIQLCPGGSIQINPKVIMIYARFIIISCAGGPASAVHNEDKDSNSVNPLLLILNPVRSISPSIAVISGSLQGFGNTNFSLFYL
jgi:hypothetical protein